MTWATLPVPSETLESRGQTAEKKELWQAVCDKANKKYIWFIRL